MELLEGVWYKQTNGATYKVLSIEENGDYIAEGTDYKGEFCAASLFGNVNDGGALIGIRQATNKEVRECLKLRIV